MTRPLVTGRFWLALGSLATVLLAQYLFTGEWLTRTVDTNYRIWRPAFTVACGLLIAGAVMAALAFVRERQDRSHQESPAVNEHPNRGRVPLAWILAIPTASYLASLMIYWTTGENGVVHFLWAASAAALVGPLFLVERTSARLFRLSQRLTRPLAWAECLAVAAIALAGFELRYWRLTQLPIHFDDDVSLMGWFSLDMMHHGDGRWFGMSLSGHVLSIHQLQIWSMWLFGENHYGLVMVSVLAGTLTLPLLYLLGRETFGRWTAFAAMALLTGSYVHIHFSRIMFGPIATFMMTGALCAFFRGWRSQRDLPFAVSGLFLGAALLTYDSARVAPVVIGALFLTSRFWKPETTTLTVNARQWILLAAGSLLAFGPMLAFIIQDFSAFVGRGHTVMLWTPLTWHHSLEKYGAHGFGGVLLEQFRHTVLALHLYGDESSHFALQRPMVSAITAALFTMGAGFCVWRWRDPRCLAPLAWIGVTFLLGGVFTSDPPYWPHLNIALPAIMLIAGFAADRFGRIVFRTATNPRGALAFGAILTIALSLNAAHSWKIYRKFAAHTDDVRVQSARYIQDLPPRTHVYLVDPVIGWDMYSFKFLNRHVDGVTLRPQDLKSPAAMPAVVEPTVFIVYHSTECVPLICDAYEGERVEPHLDVNGNLAFTSIAIKATAHPLASGGRMPDRPWELPGWRLVAAASLSLLLVMMRRRRLWTMHPPLAATQWG